MLLFWVGFVAVLCLPGGVLFVFSYFSGFFVFFGIFGNFRYFSSFFWGFWGGGVKIIPENDGGWGRPLAVVLVSLFFPIFPYFFLFFPIFSYFSLFFPFFPYFSLFFPIFSYFSLFFPIFPYFSLFLGNYFFSNKKLRGGPRGTEEDNLGIWDWENN